MSAIQHQGRLPPYMLVGRRRQQQTQPSRPLLPTLYPIENNYIGLPPYMLVGHRRQQQTQPSRPLLPTLYPIENNYIGSDVQQQFTGVADPQQQQEHPQEQQVWPPGMLFPLFPHEIFRCTALQQQQQQQQQLSGVSDPQQQEHPHEQRVQPPWMLFPVSSPREIFHGTALQQQQLPAVPQQQEAHGEPPSAIWSHLNTRPILDMGNIQDREPEICAVCLNGYDKGQMVTNLGCEHEFHNACILKWLERSNTCPLCRKRV